MRGSPRKHACRRGVDYVRREPYAATSAPARRVGVKAPATAVRAVSDTATQYRKACQQNAATTGTAIIAGKPYSCARMTPAMASARHKPIETVRKPWRFGLAVPVSVRSKLFILSLLAVAGPCVFGQMPENLVRSVAEAGSKLVAERDQYTYTQRFRFLEFHKGRPVGRYEEFRDITFTGTGERRRALQEAPHRST